MTRFRELEQEIESFTAQLQTAETFTDTAARWLRAPVDYVSTGHGHLAATAEHAAVLQVNAGSDVMCRSGRLQVRSDQVIADVYATVATARLTDAARSALDARAMPLGLILSRMGAKRHTSRIQLIETVGRFGRQVMEVDAVITLAERPVAVVNEVVYQRLFVLGAS